MPQAATTSFAVPLSCAIRRSVRNWAAFGTEDHSINMVNRDPAAAMALSIAPGARFFLSQDQEIRKSGDQEIGTDRELPPIS
jgi:hypothetical protein